MDKMQEEKIALEHQIMDIRQKAEQAERRAAELRSAEEKKHAEEIAFLKKTNAQLKVVLFLCSFKNSNFCCKVDIFM